MSLIEKAKEKDNGFFAKIGMQKTLARYIGSRRELKMC